MTDPVSFLEAVTEFLNNRPTPEPTADSNSQEPPKPIVIPIPESNSGPKVALILI